MAQHEIEVILFRQLAASLAMPIFIVDPQGTLLYCNEPAELILGRAQLLELAGVLAHLRLLVGREALVGLRELPDLFARHAAERLHRFWILGAPAALVAEVARSVPESGLEASTNRQREKFGFDAPSWISCSSRRSSPIYRGRRGERPASHWLALGAHGVVA